VILVTLGTHPQPMDRLLRRLDELVASGEISDEVIVQAPALDYVPQHLAVRSVLPFTELTDLIAQADAVISHAGPGTLATIRLAGKVPVVVPRSRRHREHVDTHQEFYARHLRALPGYIVVDDLDALADAIRRGRSETLEIGAPDVSDAVAALDEELRRAGCPR
jgi:UDP-N-acetylglucosamine transferase subunit ALG13